uniref:Uncharacterized protein n=1 Tax=viral metagenome TaxID=1070528 RepID=A0A6M3KL93_9ZZZZ
MKYILIILALLISGCSVKYYPPMSADRGSQVQYKYSMQVKKCDFCGRDTLVFKIINGKKIMCNKCYRPRFLKANGF